MKNLQTVPTSVMADFYKITHRLFYPENTTEVYSTWTPRSSAHFPVETDYAVAFGFQIFVKKYLINYFNENFFNRNKDEVIGEYEYVIKNTLGGKVESSHIAALHDLGYLPLEIKALPEGTRVPMKVPSMTVRNTSPEFYWLTNYLETIMSAELWLPSNSATMASHYRDLMNKWAIKTTGSTEGVDFQGHDFSFRGMSSMDAAISSGLGHLLSFSGTDNIPSIVGSEMYYNTKLDETFVGTSVPATEHSIMSSYGRENEVKAFKTIIERIPTGIVSIVSDTYDFWNVLETVIPSLKEQIMERDGTVVLRPDSGDPVDIICGDLNVPADLIFSEDEFGSYNSGDVKDVLKDYTWEIAKSDCEGSYNAGEESYEITFKHNDKYYAASIEVEYNRHNKEYYYPEYMTVGSIEEIELTSANKGAIEMLWDIFGGTVTDQGYKRLDSHIGLLYGDAITPERAIKIMTRLAAKGFASTNVVFGIGSYTYQFATRDSLSYALKATYAKINGIETFIQKDPATDKENFKKSLTGKVVVIEKEGSLVVVDHLTDQLESESKGNLLKTIFKNGKELNQQTLKDVKDRLYK